MIIAVYLNLGRYYCVCVILSEKKTHPVVVLLKNGSITFKRVCYCHFMLRFNIMKKIIISLQSESTGEVRSSLLTTTLNSNGQLLLPLSFPFVLGQLTPT